MLRITDKLSHQQKHIKLDSFCSFVSIKKLTAPQLAAVCRFLGLHDDYQCSKKGKRAVSKVLNGIFKRLPGNAVTATANAITAPTVMSQLVCSRPQLTQPFDTPLLRNYPLPIRNMTLSALLQPLVANAKRALVPDLISFTNQVNVNVQVCVQQLLCAMHASCRALEGGEVVCAAAQRETTTNSHLVSAPPAAAAANGQCMCFDRQKLLSVIVLVFVLVFYLYFSFAGPGSNVVLVTASLSTA
jgi:hypothetical protein